MAGKSLYHSYPPSSSSHPLLSLKTDEKVTGGGGFLVLIPESHVLLSYQNHKSQGPQGIKYLLKHIQTCDDASEQPIFYLTTWKNFLKKDSRK